MAIEVGAAYLSILPETSKIAPGIRAAFAGALPATEAEGKKHGLAFGSALGLGMKLAAGAGVVSAGVGLAKMGVSMASTMQNAQIAFTHMLGSADAAKAKLAQLQQFAAKTPFEFGDLVKASQTMVGMGVSANKVIPYLTALGDSVASTGGDAAVMNNTILAFSQTMAKGTLDMGNMNQLLQGGVPTALKVLAAQYHVTTGAMVKMISAGKVQSADALPKLISGLEHGTSATAALAGVMDEESGTLTGSWSNFMDVLSQGMGKVLAPLLPVLTKGLQAATNGLAPVFAALASGLTSLMGSLGGLKGIIGGRGGGPLGPLLDSAKQLGRTILPVFTELKAALPATFGALKNFVTPLIPIFVQFGQQLMAVAGPAFRDIGGIIATQLLPAFNAILPVLRPVAAFFLKVVGESIIGAFKGAVNVIKGALLVISGVFNIFAGIFTGDWSKVWKGIKQVLDGVWKAIIGAVQVALNVGIVGSIGKGLHAVKDLFVAGWEGARALVEGSWTRITGAVSKGIGNVVTWVKGLPGKILSALGDLGSLLLNAGQQIINGLWDGLKAKWNDVTGWFGHITNMIPHLKGPAKKDRQLLYQAGRLIMAGLHDGMQSGWSSVAKFLRSQTTYLRAHGELAAAKIAQGFKGRLEKVGLRIDAVREALKNATSDLDNLQKKAAQKFDSIKASFTDVASVFTNTDGTDPTFQSITDALTQRVSDAKEFASTISQLGGLGLNGDTLDQLTQGGVTNLAAAKSILAQGAGGVATLNALQSQLTAAGTSAGKAVSDAMYGADIKAAQGIVDGLQKKEADLTALFQRLGKQLGDEIGKAVNATRGGLSTHLPDANAPATSSKGSKSGTTIHVHGDTNPHTTAKKVAQHLNKKA